MHADTSRSDGKLQVDYNLIVENIKELNALAGDGVAKIQHTTDGARLKVTYTFFYVLLCADKRKEN